ncbi:MAG: superoxide dismutase [Mycobacteriales bacterium]|nr:MAG: superoxide dismutase [Pseudonocardiales bacterium]
MSTYSLPDLPYDYSALEPHISGQIMELHHSKHHQTYVTGANTALEKLAEARAKDSLDTVNMLQKNLAFNLAGHVNHSVFWPNMSPDGGGRPDGDLGAAIDDGFGSFDAFKAHLTAAATGLQGSGWAILAWDPIGRQPIIEQLYDHQANLAVGTQPLLMLDMWEHAFYLQYKNVKADYVTAWWNVVNWGDVAARLTAARSVSLG